jgi:uracil-DNA glycosylase family 4
MDARPAPRHAAADPAHDCALCPRLCAFTGAWRIREPQWFNGPVPSFVAAAGEETVRLLIVGLAPGLRGANRTGRPFTGDHAGELLYGTMGRFGFMRGRFEARPDDGIELVGAAITNAVRCVPPENRPEGAEIARCRPFLAATIERFPNLKAVVTLGRIAHESTVRALGLAPRQAPFSHGARIEAAGLVLFPSYHCSRYNTNTGRLTEAMFVDVFRRVREAVGE